MQDNLRSTASSEAKAQDITVCPGCDLVVTTEPLDIPFDSLLVCPRCRYRLHNPQKETVTRTMVLSLTGLLLFIPAHFMFLLQLESLGIFDQGSIIDSIGTLYQQKYFLVALAVLLTAVVFPLAKLLLLFTVSLCLSLKLYVKPLPIFFRWYCHLEEWGMTEIFLIAILITIIKMGPTATISYQTGFVLFAGLTMTVVCCTCTLDKHSYWNRIEELKKSAGQSPPPATPLPPDIEPMQQALSSGLIQCHACHKVMAHHETTDNPKQTCPRCGGIVHKRIPGSLSTTWALLLSAVFLFFPANILPIMQVDFLGSPQKSTIMDGISYFFETGSVGIGLIIFSASILVPVFKVVGLLLLLYSIHFKRWSRLTQKSVMFRFIQFIGRWSMLDIFVIALLCTLVDFGFFTRITVAPAATSFTFVVMATMFAAISFDPRLLWDTIAPSKEENKA